MRISDWSSDVCSSDLHDTVLRFAPAGVDPRREAEAITEAEVREVDGIVEIPGAAAFLARLPAERWAVVTSAPRALAYVRIAAAGLPMPPLVIGAEDVAKGKPAPDGFLAAAARLGVDRKSTRLNSSH